MWYIHIYIYIWHQAKTKWLSKTKGSCPRHAFIENGIQPERKANERQTKGKRKANERQTKGRPHKVVETTRTDSFRLY